MAVADPKRPGQSGQCLLPLPALLHPPCSPVGQSRRGIHRRHPRGQLRAAEQTGPEPRSLGLGRRGKEGAILLLGGPCFAHRPAIDPRGPDPHKKLAVQPGIVIFHCGIQCFSIQHPRPSFLSFRPIIAIPAHPGWPFSDMGAFSARPHRTNAAGSFRIYYTRKPQFFIPFSTPFPPSPSPLPPHRMAQLSGWRNVYV